MFWVLVLFYSVVVDATEVTIAQGTLNGTYLTARSGRVFNAFLGLPFAEPPVGSLRFKGPVEPKPWTGLWNASDIRNVCVQIPEGADEVTGSEDCLYLNVYTPLNTERGDNLSVIVYIYGGIFKYSGNQNNGPNYILERDVIFVVPNFRGGPLGFLSTGDTVIPGNFGLKDQIMALKWVQKNIYDFGGDPNKVTIQGHSSGAICVHLHTLSPRSKGLFQQVIIQSGPGTCSLSYFGPDVARSVAKEFAVRTGCPTNSSEDMLECFMKLDSYIMPVIQEEMYVWNKDPDAAFRPTIEDVNVPDAFITEVPNNMEYHSPDQPWIIGITTAEDAGKVANYLKNDGKLITEIDENYKLLFPVTMQYLWNTKPKYLDFTSQTIRKKYFGDQEIGLETDLKMTKMYTDAMFGYCTTDVILKYPGQKYVYLYDYVANYSYVEYEYRYLGVSHADDIVLIIYKEDAAAWFTERDIIFSDELVKRFVNFVQTGNPNLPVVIDENMMSAWEPMTSRRIEYLFMKLNGEMRTDFYEGTYQFWKSLPIGSKYYT